jgi:Bacterial archaeo-eukaryotic release factor family 2
MNTMVSPLTVATIRDLVRPTDPVVSVYLGLEPAYPTLDALEDLDLRWRALSARLAARRADVASLDAVAGRLAETGPRPGELALFAAHGNLLLSQPIPHGQRFDRARFGAPASVVPLLGWLQRHPAYVAVMTDRTGADLTVVPAGAWYGTTSVVVGPDDEIERNAPGGWSQPRYQRRAEDSWRHNATAVAEAVARAVHDVEAGLVLVGGDVRAVQLLREHLQPLVRKGIVIAPLPGGRSPDGSAAGRGTAIAAAVRAYADRQTRAILTALERHSGRYGAAAYGARNTLAALAAGRVRTLFVADREDDERSCAFASARPGDPVRVRGRLVDVAVRAALLTDAEVRVLEPGTVKDDLAALCRFRS